MEPTGEASNAEQSDFGSGPVVGSAAHGNAWSIVFLPPEDGGSTSPEFLEGKKFLPIVAAMTREIYSGAIECSEEEDCEFYGDRHFVFQVKDSGPSSEVMNRCMTWHRRLSEVPIAVRGMFRLSPDLRK